MDASLLLPPTETPLTGIDFTRRLPCGDTEKARRVRKHVYIICTYVNSSHNKIKSLNLKSQLNGMKYKY